MERPIVSAQAKREYVEAIYQRYRRAKRAEKRQMLDEFCHVARYHRKSAIRLLTGPAPGAVRPPRRRDILYTAAAIEALRAIWEAAGYPWSLRLKALLPLWLPWARRRLHLRPAVERQVLAISPRQMDRRVGPAPPPASEAAVRPHQARHPAQAPLPPQDRPLGTHNPAGFADDRFTQRRGLFL